jgi:hypothetical protein
MLATRRNFTKDDLLAESATVSVIAWELIGNAG